MLAIQLKDLKQTNKRKTIGEASALDRTVVHSQEKMRKPRTNSQQNSPENAKKKGEKKKHEVESYNRPIDNCPLLFCLLFVSEFVRLHLICLFLFSFLFVLSI
jgi:hypothetical protein